VARGSLLTFPGYGVYRGHTLFLRNGIFIVGVAVCLPGFCFDFCPAYFILAGRIEFVSYVLCFHGANRLLWDYLEASLSASALNALLIVRFFVVSVLH
jgi:hypothetical protein